MHIQTVCIHSNVELLSEALLFINMRTVQLHLWV